MLSDADVRKHWKYSNEVLKIICNHLVMLVVSTYFSLLKCNENTLFM